MNGVENIFRFHSKYFIIEIVLAYKSQIINIFEYQIIREPVEAKTKLLLNLTCYILSEILLIGDKHLLINVTILTNYCYQN